MHKLYWLVDIQRFGGEGGGSGAGDGGGTAAAADGTGNTGVTDPAAVDQRMHTRRRKAQPNPLADVQYGIQQEAAEQSPDATQEQPTESFEDLIKGKYKKEYGESVQRIISERFKNQADNTAVLDKLKPMLQALAQQRGVDEDDMDGLIASVMDDDELYEDEAIERGMSVDSLKAIKRLERENEHMRAQQEQSIREQQMRQHFNRLGQQAEEAKQFYPGLDLNVEMHNPEFVRLTSPGVGLDVRTAFEIVHRDELRGAEMQYAANRRAADMSRAIQSGSKRPNEGGLNPAGGRASAKTDPTTLTKADRAEIKRRVARGEKIVF